MWRTKNWLGFDDRMKSNNPPVPINTLVTLPEVFEAGADAMLESLKRETDRIIDLPEGDRLYLIVIRESKNDR